MFFISSLFLLELALTKFSLIHKTFFFLGEKYEQSNHYDLIYIDPMFSGVGKSKAKKALQALRELTQISDTKGLLDLSIKKASKRVVVKRHKN